MPSAPGDEAERNEEEQERERRRRGAAALLARIRRAAERVCRAVGTADDVGDIIGDLVSDIRQLADATEADELLPVGLRDRLAGLADQFDRGRDVVGQLAQACDLAEPLFEDVDAELSPGEAGGGGGGGGGGPLPAALAFMALAAAVVGAVVLIFIVLPDGDDDDDGTPVPTSPPGPTTPAPPSLALSGDSLDFGLERSAIIVLVTNDGEEPLEWEVSDQPPWISIDASERNADGEGSLTVTVNAEGIPAGQDNLDGAIELSSNAGSASIAVAARVRPPDLVAELELLGDPEFIGEEFLIAAAVTIRNLGEMTAAPTKIAISFFEPDGSGPFDTPFTTAGQRGFYPFTSEELAGGSFEVVTGRIVFAFPQAIADGTVRLVAQADSCNSEEFTPRECRVGESDESNNFSDEVVLTLPGIPITIRSFDAVQITECFVELSWTLDPDVDGELALLRDGQSIHSESASDGSFQDRTPNGNYSVVYTIQTTSEFGLREVSQPRRVSDGCFPEP